MILVGPTAVGKSHLALELARLYDGEVVNADALQAYRGFNVGTAKPSTAERQRVPHHLLDILEPHERYSAGEFARRARQAIAEIQARGRLPIVVGGSGLYVRALCAGISPMPPGDETVRQALRMRARAEGLAPLRAELAALDPETAQRLMPGDSQRITRALEVALVSGRPLSSWIREQPFGEHPLSALRIGLTLSRAILYDRIGQRTRRMLEQGWLEEVASLLASGLSTTLPAFQAIGYRELAAHLGGRMSQEEAVEAIGVATRRFAKRQLTWFRKEPEITWFESLEPITILKRVGAYIERCSVGGEPYDEASHQHPGWLLVPEPEGRQAHGGGADHGPSPPRTAQEV